MAEEFRFRIDTAEVALLGGEYIARVNHLGVREASRRLGCHPADKHFIETLIRIELHADACRAVPTPAFERALETLWEGNPSWRPS